MDYNQEWLLANSRGSYSSSTISFAGTRTYHGILVVSNPADYQRYVILSKLFEELEFSVKQFSLDTNYYPDTVYPTGCKYIDDFSIFPFPVINYTVDGNRIKKSLVMDPESDMVVIRYEFFKKIPEKVTLYPLLAFRNFHDVVRAGEREFRFSESENFYNFSDSSFTLHISRVGSFINEGYWYYNFIYPVEKERGTNSTEDLYNPGKIIINPVKNPLDIKITMEDAQTHNFDEIVGIINKLGSSKEKNPDINALRFSSSKFRLKDDLIAGYHWFGPWTRDTFISMPGLVIIPGNYEFARSIFSNYAGRMVNGIVPNNAYSSEFYRSADASLWYIYALHKYYHYSHDKSFISQMYGRVKSIVDAYFNGNDDFYLDGRFIHIKSAQMTWMDGKTGDVSFTPRLGKPVEINALWYNALNSYSYFSRITGSKVGDRVEDVLSSFRNEFIKRFTVNGQIADVIDPVDVSFRPNFLFAYSLPYKLMDRPDFLEKAVNELATPYGIRTLSPEDPKFKGIYSGDQYERDSAYHNGTVWPWLAGPYISAMVNNGHDPGELLRYFSPLFSMKNVPEIFDGLNPGIPRGCMMQAWSYGELIRSYYEDLKISRRPKITGGDKS
ncbi:MAG: amylo-alpha-1,6-glucosidase [Ferroplasma sp.]|uniref:amylo-alpha-1,6-glucosidase n=1 Tax=Ferroplasma sp. TaxID=2591003 RepID=UPI0028160A32|nr:amylo-alpha-1,6-glucosidase [Ferroplasma sp.]WMT51944.1 MAG: amylo-alpha-1,6-glucosidase [Ferroplasma sp.]